MSGSEGGVDPVKLAQQCWPSESLSNHGHGLGIALRFYLLGCALRRIIEAVVTRAEHLYLCVAGPLKKVEPKETVSDIRTDRQRAVVAQDPGTRAER